MDPPRQLQRETLHQIRARIERLQKQGQQPMEVIMSPETWARLKSQYCDAKPGMNPSVISARDVLGIRNKLTPGLQGVAVRYFGGMDMPPEEMTRGGYVDPARLRVRRATDGDKGQ